MDDVGSDRTGSRHTVLDRQGHDGGAGRCAGRRRGDRVRAVGEAEHRRHRRVTRLGRPVPVGSMAAPRAVGLAPIAVLACAIPSVLGGDLEDGARRSAFTGFGAIWICWSLSLLVVLSSNAFLIFFAVAATDVAAWCGGKGLRRFAWARRPLSPLSPNKTIGGLAGAVIGAFLVLTLLGTMSIGLLIAVAFGGMLGDLLESMVKRQAQVKDAGDLAARLRRFARPDRLATAGSPAGLPPRLRDRSPQGCDDVNL